MPIVNQTASEHYLSNLCKQSFLSLWSWPNLYRDQFIPGNRWGKEICDHLVVFDKHLMIFSDKACKFPESGNLQVDWDRWFRRAIWDAAKQVWGAERWFREQPGRVFLNPECTKPFPLSIPDLNECDVHRIIVAHGSGDRCKKAMGGSRSLMIMPRIVGEQHFKQHTEPIAPFAVGDLDPCKGFVHVIDDMSLDILLQTLDTATDFVTYLQKRAALIRSGMLVSAAGEEDLLAYYLYNSNDKGDHYFKKPEGARLVVGERFWTDFQKHPERLAQIRENEVSYSWDRLIETFSRHVLGGTLYSFGDEPISTHEIGLRYLARETRTKRRFLAKAILGIIKRGNDHKRAARVMTPTGPGDPYYIFLSLDPLIAANHDEYRTIRRNLLESYCYVVRLLHPDAEDVVGIATEPEKYEEKRSEDLVYFDARSWNPELKAEAKEWHEKHGLLKTVHRFEYTESEYPRERLEQARKGRNRNKACYCGSGKKYKRCCGLNQA